MLADEIHYSTNFRACQTLGNCFQSSVSFLLYFPPPFAKTTFVILLNAWWCPPHWYLQAFSFQPSFLILFRSATWRCCYKSSLCGHRQSCWHDPGSECLASWCEMPAEPPARLEFLILGHPGIHKSFQPHPSLLSQWARGKIWISLWSAEEFRKQSQSFSVCPWP